MASDRWQDPAFPEELRASGLSVDVPPWVSEGYRRVTGTWDVRDRLLAALAGCSPMPNVSRSRATFSTPSGLMVVAVLAYPMELLAAAVAAEARRHRGDHPELWRSVSSGYSSLSRTVTDGAAGVLDDGRFGQDLPADVLAEATTSRLLLDAAGVSAVAGGHAALRILADALVADPQVLDVAVLLDRDGPQVTVDRPAPQEPAAGRRM